MLASPRIWIGGAVLALAATTFAPRALAADEEGPKKVERVKVRLVLDQDQEGAPDRLTLDDLGDMQFGETRSYSTQSGKPVTVTRDQAGWEIDVDGKKLRVSDQKAGEGDVFVHRMKRFELGEDGKVKSMVFLSGDAADDDDVHIVREIGPGGAHGFAYGSDGAGMLLGQEALIERLQENEKFRSLDAATQELVLEAIRESAPKLQWIEEGGGEAGKKFIVMDVEEHEKKQDDE